MLIGRLSCLFNRHKPSRKTVRRAGPHYLGACRWCNKPILRKGKGGWRVNTHYTPESEQN